MTDPVADLLTRIRNGQQARLPLVAMPHSRTRESIARILKGEGYISDVAVEGSKIKTLKLKLKYHERRGVIEGLKRKSRPGLRHYVGSKQIPRVLGGLGIAILSTPKGVMTGTEARRQNVGGEVLCYIW